MKTLIALRKTWIFWLDRAAIYTLPLGTLLTMFLVATDQAEFKVCVIGVLSVSFVLSIANHVCLYHFVKCPVCHWNLSTFKDGKKIQPKYLYNAFSAGKPCLQCGWLPGEKVTDHATKVQQNRAKQELGSQGTDGGNADVVQTPESIKKD